MSRTRTASLLLSALVAVSLVVPAAGATSVGVGGEDPEALHLRSPDPPRVPGWPSAPPATALAYVVVDLEARQVIAARDADVPRPVASTVKLLSALTARRLLPDPTAEVVVGAEVVGVEGASTGLVPGAVVTVEQLLAAALVRSGNDAVRALAAAASGDEAAFVAQMRVDAARLGIDPVLATSTGLDDANLLTPLDLVVLGDAVLRDPVLAPLVDLPEVDLPGLGPVPNRNLLVLDDPTVTGLKTGFTSASGASVVVSAVREGRPLVAVVVGAETLDARFAEASALLDLVADLAPVAVPAATRIGCGGPDPVLRPPPGDLLVPDGAEVAVVRPALGCASGDGTVVRTRVLVDGVSLAEVEEVVVRTAPVERGTDAALGRGLADLLQRAARAVPPG